MFLSRRFYSLGFGVFWLGGFLGERRWLVKFGFLFLRCSFNLYPRLVSDSSNPPTSTGQVQLEMKQDVHSLLHMPQTFETRSPQPGASILLARLGAHTQTTWFIT